MCIKTHETRKATSHTTTLVTFHTQTQGNKNALFKSIDEYLFYLSLIGGQTYIYHSL